MGSVRVTWEGRNRDRHTRERLVEALEPFALASNAFLPEPRPPLRLDGPVEGTALFLLPPVVVALLNESLEEREATASAVERAGGSLFPSDWRPAFSCSETLGIPDLPDLCNSASPAPERSSHAKWFVRLPSPNLHGIQWWVCDPRHPFTPGLDVGFVHLVFPEAPLLDGLLFETQGEIRSEAFDEPALGAADWHLARPSIGLRYFLEGWFDRFLSWVRFFHFPGLRTWTHHENAARYGFERAARYRLRYEKSSRSDLEAAVAAELLNEFRQETRTWGLERSHTEAEAVRAKENARLASLLESGGPSERPRLLRAMAEGLKDQAWLLEHWPGREGEYAALRKAYEERLEQLESERTPEEQLIAFAEERLRAGTWCSEEEDELEWKEALSAYDAHWVDLDEEAGTRRATGAEADDAALAQARAERPEPQQPVHPAIVRARALTEGLEALSTVAAERRPPGLEARFRLQLARKALAEKGWAAALDEAERALSFWEAADVTQHVAADWEGIAFAHSVAADARAALGRLEEAVEHLQSGLVRLRERRADVTGASAEEAASLASLGARQRALGRPEDARASFLSAEAAHLALLEQADSSPWRWRDCRLDVLQRLAELEAERGEPAVALRHLATLLSIEHGAGARAVAALRLVAEIELRRGRFAEAAEAARDGLQAVHPVTVPPSSDSRALEEVLREVRRRDPRGLSESVVSGAPS